MAATKYSRVPTTDNEASWSFDFSPAFTFDKDSQSKYKSAFTYDDCHVTINDNKMSKQTANMNLDKLARWLITIGFALFYIIFLPITVWFSLKKIPEYKKLVVFRLGRLHKCDGPGYVFVLPLLDKYHAIDTRLRAFSVPPKQIITGDGAIIEVGADIYFQIVDAEKSVTSVQNLDASTRILVQTALCNILVQKSLTEIEAERRSIADMVLINSTKTSNKWGVDITRVELSQIKVLSGPAPKQTPAVMMPPGILESFGLGGARASSAASSIEQLASAITAEQGPMRAQAISQALHSLVAPGVTQVQTKDAAASDLTSVKQDVEGDSRSAFDYSCIAMEEGKNTIFSPSELITGSSVMLGQNQEVLQPEEVVAMIRRALCETVVHKVGETYQFEIAGAGEGTYFLDLKHGAGSIGHGPDMSGDPAATLSLTFDDLQAMLLGELKPFQAYMSGRLKISGDVSAALKLEELGSKIQAQTMIKAHL